uniref:Protein translocase subunit SecA n=1 Tax=candidate division CPR3 bacterium TaxID=2268181 RepID=A0A7C5US05_UNCC3
MFVPFLDPQKRQLKKLQSIVEETNKLEEKIRRLNDDQLKEEVLRLKGEAQKILPSSKNLKLTREKGKPWTTLSEGKRFIESLDDIIAYSAALVREATLRVSPKHRLRDVQIMCSAALAKGKLAEFFTGEGKTFAALVPLMVYSLFGRGAHLVTVNEYLAKRDAEWAGRIFDKLGLTVGCVTHEGAFKFVPLEELKNYKEADIVERASKTNWDLLNTMIGDFLVEISKKDAYRCDITYGTNSEFGFDYLRDNMALNLEDINQRELFYCIVDEADSILIDESRTPLIISGPADEDIALYEKFAQVVARLNESDVEIDEKEHSVTLKEECVDKVEKWLGVKNIWEDYQLSHHLDNALKARFLYKRDDQYIVQDGKVLIVDEFTGRVLPGRRWSEGLHQAIEAKEHVEIKQRSKTYATITYQNFFRLYYVLAGMTGTALTEAEEFSKIYNLDVVVIPTYKPVIRKDFTDVVYKTQDAKFRAVVNEIKERHEKGQPILVGTTSVEKSEKLSQLLSREGIKHEVLNAKNHMKEAQIVAKAGEYGSVTISTNMAGRGTDIRLGEGLIEDLSYSNIFYALKKMGVIGGMRNQNAFKSVVIHTYTDFEYNKVKEAAESVLNYIKEGKVSELMNTKRRLDPIRSLKNRKDIAESIILQFDPSKRTVIFSHLNGTKLFNLIKPQGDLLNTDANLGLHVIGTERHEARRIDNQLRGRSGRQGDPGSSRFYVSLDDDLMRIFGGEIINSFFNRLGVADDIPIEAKIIASQIEAAQKRVEGYNFDIRKHLVEYDDVMNEHREVFYAKRMGVLEMFDHDIKKVQKYGVKEDEDLDADIKEGVFLLRDLTIKKIKDELSRIVDIHQHDGRVRDADILQILQAFNEIVLSDTLEEVVSTRYKIPFQKWKNRILKIENADSLKEKLFGVIDEVYDFKESLLGSEIMRQIEKWAWLTVMDQHWTDHLDFMQDLRSAIGLRGYGQREPLAEYKNEAFDLFAQMVSSIESNVVRRILKVNVTVKPSISEKRLTTTNQQEGREGVYKEVAQSVMEKENKRKEVKHVKSGKIGRNDPCPCGSGKKYKRCCYPKYG